MGEENSIILLYINRDRYSRYLLGGEKKMEERVKKILTEGYSRLVRWRSLGFERFEKRGRE